ncbi:hypothetical protein FKV24_004505 [Lysobacter maris]|uniref:Uncharacterized protein n=1 Tax=Marilutibacter maris TaxID=1605891 RepID=A0A508AWN4_9GAMM|nr:hypothetical protein [Lysobacter maris]KAB8196212.1 hypothetical protein FKV24_004505 [Lysobacter maris]
MKITLALVLLLAGCSNASACSRSLDGTWKSDGQATMAFVREHTKLQPKTEAFLQALVGHMTMTFEGGELHLNMPDIEVPISGQMSPFSGFEERKPYEVLFCSSSTIVWSARQPFGDTDEVTTFNFVDPDTIWVYTGSTDPKMPDLHTREYFRRGR